MTKINKFIGALSAFALGAGAYAGPALAEHDDGDRKWTFSFNIGATSDYVFRGVSQNDEQPALQGGVDIGYGLFYVGAWASIVDADFVGGSHSEIDLYGGITPSAGIFDFDFGFIYYGYPAAQSSQGVDYWEAKVGVSTDDLIKKVTLGVTVYYSPEYTFKSGDVWTVEGSVSYALPAIGPISPTISALVGHQSGGNDYEVAGIANGDDNFTYWNAGLELAIEKLAFDLRYWDTDISGPGALPGLADERLVFTGTFTY